MPDFGDIDPDTGRTSARTEFEGTVDPNAPSVANGQITPEQWARYEAARRRAAIIGYITTIAGMAAAQPLVNSLGIGTAGAGTTASAAGLPPVSGGAPWAVTPYAGTAASVPTGAATVGGTVGGAGAAGAIPGYTPGWEGNSNLLFGGGSGTSGAAATSLPSGYTPGWEGNSNIVGAGIDAATDGARRYAGLTRDQWLKLATAVGTRAAGSFGGDRSDYSPDATSNDPNMRRLLETMQGRLDKSEPLYDSVMAMADGLLPTRYQRGGGGR